MNSEPCEVPLLERLRSVPRKNYEVVVETSPLGGSRSIPYGEFCHRAADEIERLQKINLPAPEEHKASPPEKVTGAAPQGDSGAGISALIDSALTESDFLRLEINCPGSMRYSISETGKKILEFVIECFGGDAPMEQPNLTAPANPTTGAAAAQVTEAKAITRWSLDECGEMEKSELGALVIYTDHLSHLKDAMESACAEWKKAHKVMKQVAFAEQKERRDLQTEVKSLTASRNNLLRIVKGISAVILRNQNKGTVLECVQRVVNQLTAKSQEAETLREDKARLDYLETHPGQFGPVIRDNRVVLWVLHKQLPLQKDATLREAIDVLRAALTQTKGTP